jgi:phage shock protein E
MAGSANSKNRQSAGSKKTASKASSGATTSKTLIWTIVIVALVIGGFLLLRPAAGSGGGVKNVDEKGVLQAQKDGVRIIDVRSTGEYEAGHVPGAENVPIDQFASASAGWDKNAPVLVYCATGARSSEAVSILKAAGFKNIYHFNEGLQAWTGKLDTANTASTPSAAPKPTARPIMYEFYTDW